MKNKPRNKMVGRMMWFLIGTVVGPAIVFGALYATTDKSERPSPPTEGETFVRPWGVMDVDDLHAAPDALRTTVVTAARNGIKAEAGADIPEYAMLALSGGGSNGAYGSGFLNGWTAAGTRPDFKIVTGVSTGSLQATLAFLGPAYDADLKAVFTEYATEDIRSARPLMAPLYQDALFDTAGLRGLIERYITEKVLREVAAKHADGSRLYVGTTSLETMQFMIWDMGAIASSGRPDALELYHDVLLASAAVPILFPPVYLPVEEDGETHYEMHVDGGTYAQVFFRGFLLGYDDVVQDAQEHGAIRMKLYVIRNGRLIEGPIRSNVRPRVAAIATRTIESLFDVTTQAQMLRMFNLCDRIGIEFNVASLPKEAEELSPDDFDLPKMRAMYDFAYEQAKAGYVWSNLPPGLDPVEREAMPGP